MTETIFTKGGIIYRLECRISISNFKADYLFKLMQREKGKRKWVEMKGYERQYRAVTDMKDILQYLTEEEVLQTAIAEHENISPSKCIIFKTV